MGTSVVAPFSTHGDPRVIFLRQPVKSRYKSVMMDKQRQYDRNARPLNLHELSVRATARRAEENEETAQK